MKFKKTLSLLLITGLATAQISMTGDNRNDTRKAELETKIKQYKIEETSYIIPTMFAGISTLISSVILYINIDYAKNFQILGHTVIDELLHNNIHLGILATIPAGIATVYCGIKANQAFNKFKEACKELDSIESKEDMDSSQH